jgi:hypothetical protein
MMGDTMPVCRVGGRQLGGGAMLLVLENSTHDSYNDVMSLFSTRLGWFLRRVCPACSPLTFGVCNGFETALQPAKCCSLRFGSGSVPWHATFIDRPHHSRQQVPDPVPAPADHRGTQLTRCHPRR